MSSAIWTRCGGSSEIGPLSAEPWRVVEAQHQVATRKLVDSDAEQAILEEVLERNKPPIGEGGRLHYLLFTPFRYPPLPRGSRFGGHHERGIWYGAEELRGAFAEVAYYRLLFLEGSDADLGPLAADLTAFRARVSTRRGVDLSAPRFSKWHAALASPTSYAATQPLGAAMREAGVEGFRYPSARDAQGGVNVALFTPRAFSSRKPRSFQTWRCIATRALVELACRDYLERGAFRFPREDFLVKGALPSPGL